MIENSGNGVAGCAGVFCDVLVAKGPIADYADKMMLYGQFVGHWETETVAFLPDGSTHTSIWEVHFCWVLEGRAVQDVWITPPRAERQNQKAPDRWNRYGTTIRVYDPKEDVWRITWINPISGIHSSMVARYQDGEIIQDGTEPDGRPMRWIFSDITPDSFRWRAETLAEGQIEWRMEQEMLVRRV